MIVELTRMADLIKDEKLRGQVNEFLVNPPTDLDQPALPLEVCPAGAFHHHSYPGGLLQHTMCVTKICLGLCDIVEELYGGEVDRDLVLAGAILHDVMKVYCYEENGRNRFRTSDFGSMADHLTLMVAELYKRGYSEELIHVVASHHGDVSPTKPKTLEALIVSVADQADSDLNGKLLRAAEYLLRRSGDPRPQLNSSKEALRVVQAKSRDGWEGVQRIVDGG
ncbi:MAG: HD domain-containing protein [Candidatus Bathyarchaeota archaeon]|nr:HD domain-containing protein [Candidatus Bathyarchaeota archaeon]